MKWFLWMMPSLAMLTVLALGISLSSAQSTRPSYFDLKGPVPGFVWLPYNDLPLGAAVTVVNAPPASGPCAVGNLIAVTDIWLYVCVPTAPSGGQWRRTPLQAF